jgi:hypothetical protein
MAVPFASRLHGTGTKGISGDCGPLRGRRDDYVGNLASLARSSDLPALVPDDERPAEKTVERTRPHQADYGITVSLGVYVDRDHGSRMPLPDYSQ